MAVGDQYLHERLYRGESFEKLNEKVVTIAGCGAIGSWTAIFLGRMGVKNFRLVDKDRIEIHNISTQFFTPQNLGQYKVRALQQELYRLCKARCEVHPVILDDANAGSLLSNCDLVICSFDNQKSRQIVKKTSLELGIPCLFSAMSGEHAYFEVIWAENYMPPEDNPELEFDPCSYPLATSLCALASAVTSEIAVFFLLNGIRKECRVSFGGLLSDA